MTDKDARGLILETLYRDRRDGSIRILDPDSFGDDLDAKELRRVFRDLKNQGLVKSVASNMGEHNPKITADGIDVVEGGTAPFAITIHNDNRAITGNTFNGPTQVGDGNKQRVEAQFQSLIQAIEEAEMPQKDKARLVNRVSDLARDPALGNVVQGASLLAQLFGG